MDNRSRWSLSRIILRLIFIMMCVILIYLLIDFGSNAGDIISLYAGLQQDSKTDFPKSLQFLRAYTQKTGDITLALNTGMTKEEIDEMLEEGDPNDDSGIGDGGGGLGPSNPPVDPNLGSEYKNIASIICNTYRTGANGSFIYGSKAYTAATYNGRSVQSTHSDCSCLVSAFLYLSGLNSNYIHYSSQTLWDGAYGTKIYDVSSSTGVKFSSIQPGDVFVCNGHTAVCVDKDSTTIYFGDAGGKKNSEDTFNKGWHNSYSLSADIYTWRSTATRVYRK